MKTIVFIGFPGVSLAAKLRIQALVMASEKIDDMEKKNYFS
jgi:hypothetical protein